MTTKRPALSSVRRQTQSQYIRGPGQEDRIREGHTEKMPREWRPQADAGVATRGGRAGAKFLYSDHVWRVRV